jgi:ADP-dependent NAD(P)H-hydrate dehydratase / NAD(P)H-hydrate epimerase
VGGTTAGPTMRVLNTSQMREADRRTIEEIGVPSVVLMENAGRQVVAQLEANYADLPQRRVAILCGRGNNGGDGFVVARWLVQKHVETGIFVLGRGEDLRGDARTNLHILEQLGVAVFEIVDEEAWSTCYPDIVRSDLIIDAVFGTGLNGPLTGLAREVVGDVNRLGVPVVSIDLPSGVSADTSAIIGECIDAEMTVTLAAPKLPLVFPPAQAKAGRLVVADIGIPHEIIENLEGPRIELLTRETLQGLVAPRRVDSHKGNYGHVLVVAGSPGKTGAAHLAGVGALRSGAGLVTVAAPRSCQAVVAGQSAAYMTLGLAETEAGLVDAGALDCVLAFNADVIAVGPGLGTGDGPREFVYGLLERTHKPLVMDADALNAFEAAPDRLVARDGHLVVITPHPGEMARLLKTSTQQVQANRLDVARDFAVARRLYVVLKGHQTIVATPDGAVSINTTGNPGMATGGTGDLLTGAIAAWAGQLGDLEAACKLAVYLHGAAGDLAEADQGEIAMTSLDLADYLGDAVLELTARRRTAE